MEFSGKTIDAAIEAGLLELNIDRNDAIITVLEEGVKGVLGIGGKKAKVNIEPKGDDKKRATDFLDDLFEMLNIPATAKATEENDKIVIELISSASSSLIGYRGEMLDAFQTLASAVANIGNSEYKHVVVNCEGYREKREETLKALAVRLANKAIKLGKKVSLEPMNPFERRIIHSALTDVEHVKTESQGEEPRRYVVIVPDNFKEGGDRRRDGGRRERGDRYGSRRTTGAKSEMLRLNQKTSGFGTFLGNAHKDK